ncbi:hypothetical protein C8R44DRAFT_750440 [Mycena epipterygia]|nr:hypothetical protein C8R44DRAFT_750440 [Mycena epipterygia]
MIYLAFNSWSGGKSIANASRVVGDHANWGAQAAADGARRGAQAVQDATPPAVKEKLGQAAVAIDSRYTFRVSIYALTRISKRPPNLKKLVMLLPSGVLCSGLWLLCSTLVCLDSPHLKLEQNSINVLPTIHQIRVLNLWLPVARTPREHGNRPQTSGRTKADIVSVAIAVALFPLAVVSVTFVLVFGAILALVPPVLVGYALDFGDLRSLLHLGARLARVDRMLCMKKKQNEYENGDPKTKPESEQTNEKCGYTGQKKVGNMVEGTPRAAYITNGHVNMCANPSTLLGSHADVYLQPDQDTKNTQNRSKMQANECDAKAKKGKKEDKKRGRKEPSPEREKEGKRNEREKVKNKRAIGCDRPRVIAL